MPGRGRAVHRGRRRHLQVRGSGGAQPGAQADDHRPNHAVGVGGAGSRRPGRGRHCVWPHSKKISEGDPGPSPSPYRPLFGAEAPVSRAGAGVTLRGPGFTAVLIILMVKPTVLLGSFRQNAAPAGAWLHGSAICCNAAVRRGPRRCMHACERNALQCSFAVCMHASAPASSWLAALPHTRHTPFVWAPTQPSTSRVGQISKPKPPYCLSETIVFTAYRPYQYSLKYGFGQPYPPAKAKGCGSLPRWRATTASLLHRIAALLCNTLCNKLPRRMRSAMPQVGLISSA